MSGSGLSEKARKGSGAFLLLLALVLPLAFVDVGDAKRTQGREEIVLVAPGPTRDAPGDRDSASALTLLQFPAGLADPAPEVPPPAVTRVATLEAERISGSAVLEFCPPPPRRA